MALSICQTMHLLNKINNPQNFTIQVYAAMEKLTKELRQ